MTKKGGGLKLRAVRYKPDNKAGTEFIPDWHIPDDWWVATAEVTNTPDSPARDRKEGVLVPNIGVFEATALEPAEMPTGAEYHAQTKFRRDLASTFSLLGLGLGSRNNPRRDVRLDVTSTAGNPDWDDLDDLRAGNK